MMRSTQIRAYAADRPDLPAPSGQQLFRWTRDGLLAARMGGDQNGRYRWWPPEEVSVAFLVARLVRAGFRADLAFQIARTEVTRKIDGMGHREVTVDGVVLEVWAPAAPVFPPEEAPRDRPRKPKEEDA